MHDALLAWASCRVKGMNRVMTNVLEAQEGSREAEGFDPVAYINEPRWSHSSLGLERIELLLQKLGNPQDSFRCIHVAGTNGKGSTCTYISNVLRAAGLKVALFTSPYIERFEERIQVDGRSISLDDLRAATLLVRDAAAEVEVENGEHPTEFELMAAVAFVHFARMGCDVAVIEVGLGGRLDATNVVHPDLCVIARIGLDHTDVLGDTIEKIAAEKAGIIKPGVPVVSWPQEPAAMEVIASTCERLECPLNCPDFSQLEVGPLNACDWTRAFSYKGIPYTTHLIASYQPYNAALAIEAIEHAVLPHVTHEQLEDALPVGIAATTWPGRFEVVSVSPLIVVDGSHNPQGADALATTLEELAGFFGSDDSSLLGRSLRFHSSVATLPAGVENSNSSQGERIVREFAGSTGFDATLPILQPTNAGEISSRLGDDASALQISPSRLGAKPRQRVSASERAVNAESGFTFVMGVLADKEYPHIIAPMLPFARRFVVYAPPNPRALSAEELAQAIHRQAPDMEIVVCASPSEAIDEALALHEPNSGIVAFGTLYAIGALKQELRDRGVIQ